MSKTFTAILVAILTLAFAPSTQAQSFTEIAMARLAAGPGNRQVHYGQSGYSRRNGYNTPDPTIYDRGYDTPDRGHHQATQNNVNVWGAINTGLQLYNAWETRKVNRKLDKLDRSMMDDDRRPRRERHNDYEPAQHVERQLDPMPPTPPSVAPPLEPQQAEVLNASGCEVILYINGSYLLALRSGEKVVVPTLIGLTAAGNFGGKTTYAVINPFSNGAVVTAPRS